MATDSDVAVDIDQTTENNAKKSTNGAATDAPVVVDSDLAAKGGNADVVTPDEGLGKLQKQLKDEREARKRAEDDRAAAESRANEAARGEAEARRTAQSSQLDQLKGAIAQVSQANDVLEQQYETALASQDFKAAAKAQRTMAENAAKLAQLEAGKTHLERQPKPVPRAPVDPVEAFCSTLTAPSAAWVRAHPEFVRDPLKNKQMVAAHELAEARGYKADTDAYFRSIEKTLEVGLPVAAPAHVDDPEPEPTVDAASEATGGRQTSPAAAPVTRSANGAGGGRPNVVRLTSDEVEMARNMFPDSKDPLGEYARNKVALKKEGKL